MSERCETDKTPQAKANATDKFNSIARHNQRHCLFNNAATTNQAIFSAIFNSLLENHPIFGGESKQNEFLVNGERLVGPQGANYFETPIRPEDFFYEEWRELGLPVEFQYQAWAQELKPLEFDRTSYYYMWPVLGDKSDSIGYYFDDRGWVRNIWDNDLDGTPYSENTRQDFLKWRYDQKRYYDGDDLDRWLDGMSYESYITKVMGLSPEIARYCDEILATGVGLGADTCSAYFAYTVNMPGFKGYSATEDFLFSGPRSNRMSEMLEIDNAHSFPAGNGLIARHLIKFLIPKAIEGSPTHVHIANGRVRFDALDRAENDVRIRLSSTVVRVEHIGTPCESKYVRVTYTRGGKTYVIKAGAVIMAAGGWFNKFVVRDLPETHRQAYADFNHSAVLVANVALCNWRFLYRLGFTACRWFDGPFGFSCNLRQPMIIGDYRPPLHPDKPIMLTFYAPLVFPGHSAREQGIRGRNDLLSRSYRDYERIIREQMVTLFRGSGFDPKKDIAGIVLNRWGHAFVVPEPGFYFGKNNKPAPRDVVRARHGRISFAHSELNGLQNFRAAMTEGRRAVTQIMEVL